MSASGRDEQLEFAAKYEESSYTFEFEQSGFVPRKLLQFVDGENVIDFGCGPVLNVLGLFYTNAKKIVGFDKSEANLEFLENLMKIGAVTANQKRALRFLRSESNGLSEAFQANLLRATDDSFVKQLYAKISLIQGEVQKLDKSLIGQFDSVVQCGCFGCLGSEEEFEQSTQNAYDYLKSGGKMLMINWLQSMYRDRPFGFNSPFSCRLDRDLYSRALIGAGFKIDFLEYSEELTPTSRANGNTAILWSVARKSD
jgi:hypothetical protein